MYTIYYLSYFSTIVSLLPLALGAIHKLRNSYDVGQGWPLHYVICEWPLVSKNGTNLRIIVSD